MDLLETFMAQYAKEFDYYDQVARLAARKVEAGLQSEGVRAIVTSRAKTIVRLKDKLMKRNARNPYSSIDEIYEGIADLAGVRVALYFPAEREKVGNLVLRLFECQLIRDFPVGSESSDRRFSGYSATHYRVRLRASELDESERRYATANIEIQVASVLMHAWSEVEHDLVYKPFEGQLSEQEYSLLDQLNGLVLAGEISLEQLQRAGEVRVAESDRPFSNHYELAAHLLSSASEISPNEITDQGMGRVDLLFALINRLGLRTPNDLKPYLLSIHGDLEKRPLSDQIIDSVLGEDESRYDTYREVRKNFEGLSDGVSDKDKIYFDSGMFLGKWAQLERLMHDLIPSKNGIMAPAATVGKLLSEGIVDLDTYMEIDRLRRFRNVVVHGLEIPSDVRIGDLTKRIEAMISKLEELG